MTACCTVLLSAEAQLQSEVLREKARASGLEVQIRALSLELTHAREHAGMLLWLGPVCTLHYRLPGHHGKELAAAVGMPDVQLRCMLHGKIVSSI